MVDVPYDARADAPPAEVPEVELYHPKSWWTQYVFSQDAKVIAIQYSLTASAIGLVALVLSWLMRLQLGFPGTFSFIDASQYLQFITMHGMIMVIYLLTALFLGGFGNYLIPLMVGARDMVFPYVNMLSYWIYLLAVLVLASTFFVPGGPTGAGWTLYPPQAVLSGTPGQDWGIVLMLVSLILFIIGFTMGGLNYVVTVLQARTRGMTLMRMPLTVWGIFTATVMALLAFPALFVASVMMLFDRLLGTSFFMPALVEMGQQMKYGGGSPILFQHLFWFFGHPEVYIVALPAFGIVSDLISTHARKNIFGYRMMVWAIVGIGALSFVVWAHHMYVSGMHPKFGFFFATTTLIIAIPTAIKVYNWVLTLWRGDIHLTVPMLFALGFIITFVNGGLTGLFLGNVVVDVPLSDTMFVVAHFHMVMGVAPIMVVLGAIYHWYPKVTGRMLDDWMGKFHFWVTFLGAYLIFFPMHYLGLQGVPRRYHDIGEAAFITPNVHTLNAFITVMALIVGFAQMVFLFNLVWSLFKGRPSGGNPWRATTLEWQTPETPPGHGNWGKELPVVYRWAYDYSVPGAARGLHSAEPAAGDAGPSGSCSVSAIILFMAVIAVIVGWWLSQQRLTAKPWLEEGSIDDFPGTGAIDLAGSEDRTGRVSRCRRLAVRTLHQRLLHAHEHGGLAHDARAFAAVVQHGRPGPEQCCAAMGTRGRAPGRHGRCHRRPLRRRSVRGYIPDRATAGVATAARSGLFRRVQSSQFLLLHDDRGARAAPDGRSGGARQNDCQGVAWRRDGPAAPERGALHDLLAFPAVGLAGLAWSADGLDGRFRRHLSPVAHLGETRWQRLC